MLNQDETHMVLVPIFAWTVCVLTPLRTLKLNQDTVSNISPRLKAYGRVQVYAVLPVLLLFRITLTAFHRMSTRTCSVRIFLRLCVEYAVE